MHHPTEEVRGFHKSHKTPPSGEHLLRFYKMDMTMLRIHYLLRVVQVPEMARSSWMAKKFTMGMTYQWKAKDLANAREYL